jgi:hypothetical protein
MRPQLLLLSLSCPARLPPGGRAGDRSQGSCSPRDAAGRYSEAVPELTGGDPRFRADAGHADPAVARALAALAAGTGSEHAALTALAGARLLVPVMAVLADQLAGAEAGPSGGLQTGLAGGDAGPAGRGEEKRSEMATPAIVGRDGRLAMAAFTSLETLRRWQPDARPVPVPASGVWQSAVQESQAVIIDVAGPVPLAVEGARLSALASGGPIPRLHEDPDVHAAVAAAAAAQPAGVRIRLGPPQGAADFTLELGPADPVATRPVPGSVASAIADDVAARLAGRLTRGIAVLLRPPAARRY